MRVRASSLGIKLYTIYKHQSMLIYCRQRCNQTRRVQTKMTAQNPINIEHLRQLARRRLPRPIFDFLEGGSDDEWTLRRNLQGFDHYPLMSRTLVDTSTIDTRTQLLGRELAWPVIVAPTGASQLFHPGGELAVARAAGECETLYTLSTMSNTRLEDVGAASTAPKMFQLYVFRDRSRVESLVDRCRQSGYQALCLTVDTPLSGNRERDRVNGMRIPPRWTLRNLYQFASHPTWSLNARFRSNFALANFGDIAPGASNAQQLAIEYVNSQFDRTLTWKDAEWLARLWGGPFAIKGIMSGEDARRAADIGATAVWISNHGGRQLDGLPATVSCIPAVREAVGDAVEIIVDGGIRRGTHVLKALALGANACALGRPCLYGLAAGGQSGVAHSLKLLRAEFERGMALAGCPSISDIGARQLQSFGAGSASHPSLPHS